VLISHGRVRVDDTVEDLLAEHRLLTAPAADALRGDWEVIESSTPGTQTHRLVRLASPHTVVPPGCESRPVGIEELALAYLRETAASPAPALMGVTR
jgi:ABC-2 type transport system ATP-binding protein